MKIIFSLLLVMCPMVVFAGGSQNIYMANACSDITEKEYGKGAYVLVLSMPVSGTPFSGPNPIDFSEYAYAKYSKALMYRGTVNGYPRTMNSDAVATFANLPSYEKAMQQRKNWIEEYQNWKPDQFNKYTHWHIILDDKWMK